MEVFAIGQVNNGTNANCNDASNVSYAITQTPSFRQAVSNPAQRNEFLKGLQLRQEQALASNNKTMFDLFSNVINAVKTSYSNTDIDSVNSGFKAIG